MLKKHQDTVDRQTDRQTDKYAECRSSLESLGDHVLSETLQSQKGERCIRHLDEALGAAKFTYTEHRMMLQGSRRQGSAKEFH